MNLVFRSIECCCRRRSIDFDGGVPVVLSYAGVAAILSRTSEEGIPSTSAVRSVYARRTKHVRALAPHLEIGSTGMLARNVGFAGGACLLLAIVVAAAERLRRRRRRRTVPGIVDGDQIIGARSLALVAGGSSRGGHGAVAWPALTYFGMMGAGPVHTNKGDEIIGPKRSNLLKYSPYTFPSSFISTYCCTSPHLGIDASSHWCIGPSDTDRPVSITNSQ